MAFSPATFKGNLSSAGGGARPSLFQIRINYSSNTSLSVNGDEAILVKAAALPASNIAPLAVNYAGRAYKWHGFRTYDNWTVTVINDENFSTRNKMMAWMRYISGMMDGKRSTVFGPPSNDGTWFDGEATVTQIGTDGKDKQSYKLYNLWPTELGEIALDWSSDALEEYTISFAYDHWTHGTQSSTTSSSYAFP
tara:strand:+ start:708 stop:1289 length:582 start_codon:yes stop_codon:yes gene_type:complete